MSKALDRLTSLLPKTGLLATLCALLRIGGTGAPKITAHSGRPRSLFSISVRRSLLALPISVKRSLLFLPALVLASLAFSVAPALAASAPEPPMTNEPTSIKSTSATLEGVVNPLAPAEVSWFFEYKAGAVCTGGSTTPMEGPAEVEIQPVGAPIEGLTAHTEYTVCLVSENASGKTAGNEIHFTTATPPQTPKTEAATGPTATTVTLHGELNPTGEAETGYHFLYSTEPTCAAGGSESEAVAPAKLKAKAKVEAKVEGLQPHQKYVFCIVATNTAGDNVQSVNELPFETKAAPPTIEEGSLKAKSIKARSVTLEGRVNPNNEATECKFQYGTTNVIENEIPCAPELLKGYGGQEVSSTELNEKRETVGSITGLTPGTTYKYQIVVKNGAGEKVEEATFTTNPAPEEPETREATEIAGVSARFNGVLNPKGKGEPGTYEFLYKQSGSECELSGPERIQAEKEETELGKGSEQVKIKQKRVPESANPSSVGTTEPVSMTVSDLLPGTEYAVCLRATNTIGESTTGPVVTFTTTIVGAENSPTITETGATLTAEIGTENAETTYKLQYGAGNVEEHSLPSPEASIPGSSTPTTVQQALTGLTAATTYHFRFVADNGHGPVIGAERTFTTSTASSTTAETCPNAQLRAEQPVGSTLPDCRAYEMVSPLAKAGSGAESSESRASVFNGNNPGEEEPAITYLARGSFSGSGTEPSGANLQTRYISRRTASGWSTQNLSPPYQAGKLNVAGPSKQLLFTPDLSEGLVESELLPLKSGVPAGYPALYRFQTDGSPDYELVSIGDQTYPYSDLVGLEPVPVGVSTDLSHVVIHEQEAGVHEWSGGKPSLIPGKVGGPSSTFNGENGGNESANWWRAVSADGSRVFVTIVTEKDETFNEKGGQLYVRENPMSSAEDCSVAGDACTLEVSKSQRTDCNVQRKEKEPPGYVCMGTSEPDPNGKGPNGEPWPVWYRDASANGSRVFFTSWGELTNDADTGADDNGANLYEYNLETGVLTDLSVPTTPTEKAEDPRGAEVFGLVNASEDGSYVYFVANGVLSKTANSNGEKAVPGTCEYQKGEVSVAGERTCNLYLAHYNGHSWETSFIARLAGSEELYSVFNTNVTRNDESDWYGAEYTPHFEGLQNIEHDFGPGQHSARVTPDGTTLAFESERDLTNYDTEQTAPGDCESAEVGGSSKGGEVAVYSYVHETGKCHEVYLFDAGSGSHPPTLVCASCDPSGARPVASAELGGHQNENGGLSFSSQYLPNNISENGSRLFFQSADPLVPQDSNGLVDVYEWERPASEAEAAKGENSCTSSSASFDAGEEGCVFPVSDVAGDQESNFMDATPNGDNVFFDTEDQLVPSDTDTRADVYDARVGGGFPVTMSAPGCDSGDSCKPPASPQPGIYAPSGSATFNGLGNFPPVLAPSVAVKSKTAAQFKAEKLAKALKTCRKDKRKKKRSTCEKQARKKYGVTKAKKAGNKGRAGR